MVAYHAHSFSEHIDDGLVSQSARIRQEEIAQHDVEERKRRYDGLCGYERHSGRRGARRAQGKCEYKEI